MAQSQAVNIALTMATFGCLAFVFGVVAENKKPPSGTAIHGKGGVIICSYPKDPTVPFGVLSMVSLLISGGIGFLSVFYPYKGKKVPTDALFGSKSLSVFFLIAIAVTVLAEGMMMWATVTEGLHRTHNVHYNPHAECATAKTGLFGGAAFLALDASLFWLICQMLTMNSRADYLEEDDPKGEYGQVMTTDYDVNGASSGTA